MVLIKCPYGDWEGDETLFEEHLSTVHGINIAEHVSVGGT